MSDPSAVIADTKLDPLKPETNGHTTALETVKSNGTIVPTIPDTRGNGTEYEERTKPVMNPRLPMRGRQRTQSFLVTATKRPKKEHRGIRWAPLKIPFKRRMQTAAVLWFELAVGVFLSIFWFLCAVPLFWPILLPYLLNLALTMPRADKPPRNILSPLLRSSKFWRNYTDYFPMHLHRSEELPADQNYIFGYHPHGIISHGAWGHFVTKTTGWNELFPGISNTLLTLESNFRVPGYREYLVAMGLGSVSRKSCEGLLGGVQGEMSDSEVDASIKKSSPSFFRKWRRGTGEKKLEMKNGKPVNKQGRGITIVVGGAQESLLARPGAIQLILRRRRGFVRVAIRTGAWLVPVLSFGENDLYDVLVPEKTSYVYKLQILIKRTMGFTVPLFHARGIFNYDVGLLPYRRAVNTVVGRPIEVVQDANPRDEYIDKLHKEYEEELQRLWDEHKEEFAGERDKELEFVQ